MWTFPLISIALAPLVVTFQEEGSEKPDEERGLVSLDPERVNPGYTLFAPLRSDTTYLVSNGGEVAHQWKHAGPPGNSVYLLPNGHLLRTRRVDGNPRFHGGGQGGGIVELDLRGNVVWRYDLSDDQLCHHHDIEPLPNGNILLIAWEYKSAREAVKAGRDPRLTGRDDEFWPDCVLEIQPVRPEGAKVVWEWHAWDHLVQDFDEEKPGYGSPAEHPHRIDLNADGRGRQQSEEEREDELRRLRDLGYAGDDDGDDDRGRRGRRGGGDWMHTNAVDYNAELDQILLSVRSFHEIWIIDHSTTTEEAAGSTGGRWGRGGDLLYRWGNPQMHGQGDASDRRLFGQHDAQWIPEGFPGEGRILLFNNGDRDVRAWSTVDELAPPVDAKGNYVLADGTFGPDELAWTYAPKERFFSSHISGAQRLPDGHTLVCSGEPGRFMEVTPEGEIVWEYLNPFGGSEEVRGPGGRGPGGRGPGGRGPGDGRGERRGPGGDGPQGDGPGGPPGDDRGRPRGGRGGQRGRGPGGGGGMPSTGVFRAERYALDHPGIVALMELKKNEARSGDPPERGDQ